MNDDVKQHDIATRIASIDDRRRLLHWPIDKVTILQMVQLLGQTNNTLLLLFKYNLAAPSAWKLILIKKIFIQCIQPVAYVPIGYLFLSNCPAYRLLLPQHPNLTSKPQSKTQNTLRVSERKQLFLKVHPIIHNPLIPHHT